MESLERSKAVIALGKRMVASLGNQNDLTAEWMCHLIAERMEAIESALPAEKKAAEDSCADVIYRLWSHRFIAPQGVNLLHQAEPIARVLASLAPERDGFGYFPEAMELAKTEDLKNSSDWLKLAQQLDRTSRDLIRFALRRGALDEVTSDEFKESMSELLGAGADVHFELQLVNFIASKDQDELEEQERASRFEARTRWKKATRLEHFAALATQLASELKEGLSEEPPMIESGCFSDL